MSYIEFKNVVKEYITGETKIRALNEANFSVKKGELAVILGSSGAGKTTALNILGGMDTPTSGEVWVDGKNVAKYKKKELIKNKFIIEEEILVLFGAYIREFQRNTLTLKELKEAFKIYGYEIIEFDGKNLILQEYYKYGDFCKTTFVVCEDLEKE